MHKYSALLAVCLLPGWALAADDDQVDPEQAESDMTAAYQATLDRLTALSASRPEAAAARQRFIEAQQLWERYTTEQCAAEAALHPFKQSPSRAEAYQKILSMQCRGVHAQLQADHLNNYLRNILPQT
ncbi:hypothetical protein [Lysobacter silvisoli]|uniref:DUF1311 domain-containing protein n=1 Tax=Lysobacter silvisoli TaxID=2293254 RepID=A0A371K398_9GAMM|nr:hypothetical protein [Lysobacter silvisoli]RDZ28317.1 hypothetical protein DX914_04020 [Lysobacter silvisoli]